jgi:glycosyltransferase 2 family protein
LERSSAARPSLPPGAIRVGAAGFALASLAGFAALFLITQDVEGSLAGFREFRPIWALPALGLAALDWLGGGLRLKILVRPLRLPIRFGTCVRTAAAAAALAYLTPSGSGGGPAQLYGLLRSGASLGRAVAANFASITVNLLFLSLAGFGAWALGAASEIEGIRLPVANLSAARLFEWSVLGFAGVATVILLIALSPRLPRVLIVRAFGTGPRVRTVLRFLAELHGAIRIYGAHGKTALVLATLVNVIPFGARFVMGWVVLRGFGIDAGFWNVVVLHVMLQFLLYFMPTPGGSGVAEVLAPAVMSAFLPTSLLVAYTAVWRFFLAWITIFVGGIVLFLWIHADGRQLIPAAASRTPAPGDATAGPEPAGAEGVPPEARGDRAADGSRTEVAP